MLVPAWFLRESVGKIERILYGYSMGKHIWFIIQQVRNVWAQLVHESLRLLTWKGSLLKDSQAFARASFLSIRWDSKKETGKPHIVLMSLEDVRMAWFCRCWTLNDETFAITALGCSKKKIKRVHAFSVIVLGKTPSVGLKRVLSRESQNK